MKEEVTSACLVLNSVSNVARAIRYLNDIHLTHIRAFLDNDDAGRKATTDFIRAGFKVEDMSVHYGRFKDLNEYHIQQGAWTAEKTITEYITTANQFYQDKTS